MEATIKAFGGRVLIKVAGENQKELFRQVAAADQVFNAQTECGRCKSKDIYMDVRHTEKGDYYELRCPCGARFNFGQHKEGNTLFPKFKDGWEVYGGDA